VAEPAENRRVFIEAHELPGLWLGVVRGDAPALRRILGARRGGRDGIALALLGLAGIVPGAGVAPIAAAHLLLSLAALPLHRRRGLGVRENQRLLLWWVGLALLACAALRAAGVPLPPLAALALAHVGHARNLRRGLERPGEVPRKSDRPAPASARDAST
jgi:hypothetical protein